LQKGENRKDLILGAGIPNDLWEEIKIGYDGLCEHFGDDTDVAFTEFGNC